MDVTGDGRADVVGLANNGDIWVSESGDTSLTTVTSSAHRPSAPPPSSKEVASSGCGSPTRRVAARPLNYWWELSAIDHTAMGGWYANGARLATIALGILLTVYRDRLWPRFDREDANLAYAETPRSVRLTTLASTSLASAA